MPLTPTETKVLGEVIADTVRRALEPIKARLDALEGNTRKTYRPGDRVERDGVAYVCKSEHLAYEPTVERNDLWRRD